MNRKLRLKLPDPPFRCREFGLLGRRDAGFEAGVDSRLAAPGVDRLLADLEIRSNLRHLPSAFNQIDYPAPELRRVTPSCHLNLLSPRWQRTPVFSLRQSRGTPESPEFPGRFTEQGLVFRKGKHRDSLLAKVAEEAADYLAWMLRSIDDLEDEVREALQNALDRI